MYLLPHSKRWAQEFENKTLCPQFQTPCAHTDNVTLSILSRQIKRRNPGTVLDEGCQSF